MEILLLILLVLVVLGLLPSRRSKARHWPVHAVEPMNGTERKTYRALVTVLPDHIVLAQVALNRVVQVRDTRRNRAAWNRISSKSLDFVICDEAGSVVVVLELDGPTHKGKKQRERDTVKDEALGAAGIKLVRWNTDAIPPANKMLAELDIDPAPTPAPAGQRTATPLSPRSTAALRAPTPPQTGSSPSG